MSQLLNMLPDIGLGLIAIRLVFSLEKNQKQTSALLAELTKRVDRLEKAPVEVRYLVQPAGDGN